MTNIDKLIKEIKDLSYDELRLLYKSILRQIATPLRDPQEYYDDWDDVEVDKAYADHK